MKKLGLDLEGTNEKSAYAIAVAIALILASVLLVVYFVALVPPPQRYVNMYLLDENGSAANYPEVLTSNSSFTVFVVVENHLGTTLNSAEVRVKIANNSNPTFPLAAEAAQTFVGSVQDGASWENKTTVTLNQTGNYLVAFELWTQGDSGALTYSDHVAALSIQVV